MRGGHVEGINFPGSTDCEELMEPYRAKCSLAAEVEAAHEAFGVHGRKYRLVNWPEEVKVIT